MSEDTNMVQPFSYHTFIFPFVWNISGKVTRAEFEKCMHPCWRLDVRQDVPFDRDLYAQYCYFNQAARNVIFTEADEEDPAVRNYRMDLGEISGQASWLDEKRDADNPVRYVIRKDDFEASLCVNGIRLRLFNTGVGMIVFELENYQYNDDKRINLINELGRRVFMPYIIPDGSCPLCANEISLEYPGGKVSSRMDGNVLQRNSDIRIMGLILYFLRNGEYSVTTQRYASDKQFRIEPIVDDRMFVACVWNNTAFAQQIKQDVDGQYRYLADALNKTPDWPDNVARRLYEFVFIDGTGLSCQNKQQLHEALSQHVYGRWVEYGTITGVSEYSLVAVTDFQPNINAFLTEYIEMAMLILVQRASLLAFERQISDCARKKLRVDQVQRAYVQFQSEYLLREATAQQQGIELYNMMTQKLYIEEARADVEKEISALFELDRDIGDQKDNVLLIILAVLSVFEATGFFFSKPGWVAILISVLVALCMLMLFWHNHNKRIR